MTESTKEAAPALPPDEATRRVVARIRAWIEVTPPAAFRLFWSAGRDSVGICPVCGQEFTPDGDPDPLQCYLGVYSPDPHLRRRMAEGEGGGVMMAAPADPAEAWFQVCSRCATTMTAPERERLADAQGARVRAILEATPEQPPEQPPE